MQTARADVVGLGQRRQRLLRAAAEEDRIAVMAVYDDVVERTRIASRSDCSSWGGGRRCGGNRHRPGRGCSRCDACDSWDGGACFGGAESECGRQGSGRETRQEAGGEIDQEELCERIADYTVRATLIADRALRHEGLGLVDTRSEGQCLSSDAEVFVEHRTLASPGEVHLELS